MEHGWAGIMQTDAAAVDGATKLFIGLLIVPFYVGVN